MKLRGRTKGLLIDISLGLALVPLMILIIYLIAEAL